MLGVCFPSYWGEHNVLLEAESQRGSSILGCFCRLTLMVRELLELSESRGLRLSVKCWNKARLMVWSWHFLRALPLFQINSQQTRALKQIVTTQPHVWSVLKTWQTKKQLIWPFACIAYRIFYMKCVSCYKYLAIWCINHWMTCFI